MLIAKETFNNTQSQPELSPYHKALLTRYMRVRQPPWLLLTDVGPIPGTEEYDTSTSIINNPFFSYAGADFEKPTPAQASQIRSTPIQKFQDPAPYLTCLRSLQRHQPPQTVLDKFEAGYQDYLQAPLQPLTDNLESVTYEVFEKDPVKYDQYLRAIQQALCDWHEKGKQTSGPDGRIVVAVVGAGRGPLVTRALQASDSTGIQIEMWAVEKNPNAFVLLQRHNEETWNNRVNLVKSDMRSWKGPSQSSTPSDAMNQWPPPHSSDPSTFSTGASGVSQLTQTSTHYPIDILISELLGSFADNELSPECLSPILPLLNPSHGISIPHSYTAHLTPISAPKLHADISARALTDPSAPHTPYVVLLHAIDYLSTISSRNTSFNSSVNTVPTTVPNVQEAWSFTHLPTLYPSSGPENQHHTRNARLSFPLRDRATTHGLAGFFEAVLYPSTSLSAKTSQRMPRDVAQEVIHDQETGQVVRRVYGAVELSTNPVNMERKSGGMMSWFPIFFPLKVRH